MTKILLIKLRLDFQIPECLCEEAVIDCMAKMQCGETLPPIEVRFDGSNYFLQDGFHRTEAARRLGITELDANVTPGTLADMEAEFCAMVKAIKEQLNNKE